MKRSWPAVVGTFAARFPFLVAAALVAAGLGDAVVESIANTGIFGGAYADNNHLGVIPTLLVGTVIALALLARRFLDVCRFSAHYSREQFVDVAKDLGTRSTGRDFPCIFGLQLGFLFALESIEQLIAGGTLLGGAAWLGGPPLFSVLAHAAIGALCTLALGASMRAIVRTFASLVRSAVRFIWLAISGATAGAYRLDRLFTPCARAQAPHVRQIGGRAPPLLDARLSPIS